ncbi:MAG: efflux RND transporter periplasmic adaptor subunit, partial [Candidatus Eremiobacteraeota bacterium]|nr:efflux RND transporter periplasmic adaptor subunit [Candidatus Eremiobacteraeota bacterium]
MSSKLALSLALIGLLITGCGKGETPAAAGPGGAAPPPPAVDVASVKQETVSVFRDYVAEFKPVQTVEIRTRVGGTLDSVHFAEGSMVQQGQVLFQIDPAPYEADIKAAQATLAQAEAGVSQAQGRVLESQGAVGQAEARLQKARTQVNFQESTAELARSQATLDAAEREVRRYQPLFSQGAVPGQQYDQAVDRRDVARAERDAVKARLTNTRVNDQADVGVAEADVKSARANLQSAVAAVEAARAQVLSANNELDRAQLYLSYTTIRAPFTGFIGRLNLDRGTMIVQGNAVLATLNSADPIYADFSIAEKEYLDLKKRNALAEYPFGLTLTDGERYSDNGDFVLTENNVDPSTGELVVRARFENPSFLLKPGGFGRVTMKNHEVEDAIVIPQAAVFANQSLQSVYVVGNDQTVEPRKVELGDRVGDQFVVRDGLKVGETIVVGGLQKVRPGSKVTPEPVKEKSADLPPDQSRT